MCNALHGVTGDSNGARHGTASAYAYASASVPPNQEELYVGTCTPRPGLTAADWDYLLQERTGIMHEAGMTLARAQALALGDTIGVHGSRPCREGA